MLRMDSAPAAKVPAHEAPKHYNFVRCRGLQMVGVTGNDWLQPAGTFAWTGQTW